MKSYSKICLTFLIVLSSIIISLSFPLSATTQPNYPTSIAGYPVIFVHTPGNTIGLNSENVILTVFDPNLKFDDGSIERTRSTILTYLESNPLPVNYSISIYGGPGASKEDYERNAKDDYNYKKIHGSIHFGTLNSSLPMSPLTYYPMAYGIDENRDTDYYSTVTFQSAYWYSPTVGTNQNHYSALLNNGKTNTGYLLQVGETFSGGAGQNAWGDTSTGLTAVNFTGVPYYAADNCKFALGKYTSGWFMSATDYTMGNYQEYDESNATGTYLVSDGQTSIYLENWNTNSNWYSGFSQYNSSSNYFTVRTAKDVIGGTLYNWSHELQCTVNNQGVYTYNPNQNVLSGSLVNGSSAYWYLPNMPLGH